MTWTHIKHFLLGVLIVLSLFLSFSLLTAGSQRDEQASTGNNSTPSLVADRTISEVFSPQQIVVHEAYENPLIASLQDSRALIERTYENITYEEVQEPETFTREEYQQAVAEDSWVEFVYDGQIPFGLFENGFENLPSDYENRTFNKILFNLENEQQVLFYNSSDEVIYRVGQVNYVENVIDEFRGSETIQYTEAASLELAQIVYVPREEVVVPYRNYVVRQLPDVFYIDLLFEETPEVERRVTGETRIYNDLRTKVEVNDLTNVLTYERQRANSGQLTLSERLLNSYQELRQVENWTDRSQYQSYNAATNYVVFQRYLDGLPVFSPQQLESTVRVRVGANGRRNLRIPLQIIQTPISLPGYEQKTLPSGLAIADQLEAAGVALSTVDELKVGLTWEESEEDERVIHFEPDWYVSVEEDESVYEIGRFLELQEDSLNGL